MVLQLLQKLSKQKYKKTETYILKYFILALIIFYLTNYVYSLNIKVKTEIFLNE